MPTFGDKTNRNKNRLKIAFPASSQVDVSESDSDFDSIDETSINLENSISINDENLSPIGREGGQELFIDEDI